MNMGCHLVILLEMYVCMYVVCKKENICFNRSQHYKNAISEVVLTVYKRSFHTILLPCLALWTCGYDKIVKLHVFSP